MTIRALSLKRSQTYLGAFFRRISARKDYCIALTATARKLAEHLYRALRHGQQYVEKGVAASEAKYQEDRLNYALKIARSMGYTLVPQEQLNEVSA